MVIAGAMCIFACDDVPNADVDAYDVLVNKPSTAAYRSGATNAAFAAETVIDELAEKIGMDPVEFRLKNYSERRHARRCGHEAWASGSVEILSRR